MTGGFDGCSFPSLLNRPAMSGFVLGVGETWAMSMSRQQYAKVVPTLPTGESIASYPTYAEAQKAVAYLAEERFPVEALTIVGTNLTSVERVTGRLTYGRVAIAGAMSGAWFGLFVGLLMSMFGGSGLVTGLVTGLGFTSVAIGAGFGLLFSVVSYALTRSRRDFTSSSQIVANQYAVLCKPEVAMEARRQLINSPVGIGRPVAGVPGSPVVTAVPGTMMTPIAPVVPTAPAPSASITTPSAGSTTPSAGSTTPSVAATPPVTFGQQPVTIDQIEAERARINQAAEAGTLQPYFGPAVAAGPQALQPAVANPVVAEPKPKIDSRWVTPDGKPKFGALAADHPGVVIPTAPEVVQVVPEAAPPSSGGSNPPAGGGPSGANPDPKDPFGPFAPPPR